MDVKDFLLSLNEEKLIQRYYDDYYKNNEIAQAEAKLNKLNLEERILILVKRVLQQVKDTSVIKNNEYLFFCMRYWDFDYDDDLNMKKTEIFDPSLLKLDEERDLGELQTISRMSDASKESFLTGYSVFLFPWAELLGYEICYMDSDIYGVAANIIYELTFFGYDKENCEERIADELQKLDEITEELNQGNCEEFSTEDLRKLFDLPVKSQVEEETERKIMDEIMIQNYNEKVRVYNLLRGSGLFKKGWF